MNLFLSLILSFSSVHAALPLPQPGESACYRRVYNESHMRRNLRQELSSVYVWLNRGELNEQSGAKVLGLRRNGETFLNRDPSCEFKPNGTVFCYVECDGGSFNLEPRTSSIYWRITKNYYFPLFRNGADPENPREEEVLHLNGDDRDNSLFRLYPVSNQECEDAFSRVVERSFGC